MEEPCASGEPVESKQDMRTENEAKKPRKLKSKTKKSTRIASMNDLTEICQVSDPQLTAETKKKKKIKKAKKKKASDDVCLKETDNEPENEVITPVTGLSSNRLKRWTDRRVKTINDLRAYMNSLEEQDGRMGDLAEKLLEAHLSPSRPLTPRLTDSARETRTERIQSHEHDVKFNRKERELLEAKRRARILRSLSKESLLSESTGAAATLPGAEGDELARSGLRSDLARGDSSRTPSTVGGGGGGEVDDGSTAGFAGLGALGAGARELLSRPGDELLRIKREADRTLKSMHKEADRTLKSIDPKLKAGVRKTVETRQAFSVKVLLTFAIGCITGAVVQFISFLSTQVLMNPKQSTVQSLLSRGDLLGGFFLHSVLSILLAWVSCSIVVGLPGRLSFIYAGCPGAGGSCLPEVKTYLSGAIDKHRMKELRTLIFKVLALSFLVASGIPASRDMIHVAALVATNVVTLWASRENFMVRRRIQSQVFLSSSDAPKFVFVSAGVAAGVGASFRCPFAGVMFALEEFSSFWNEETASMCLLASGSASMMAWYLSGSNPKGAWYLANFEDTSGDFDPLMIRIIPAAFARVAYPSIQWVEIGILCLLGLLGGLWGSFFVRLNGHGLAFWRRKRLGGPLARYKRLAEMALVGLLSSTVSILLPALWPCRPLTDAEQVALNDKGQRLSWKPLTCQRGQINEMATLTYQGHGTTMNNLFAESEDMQFSFVTLFAYGAIYFVVTVVSVGTASPAGAVIPMVLSGAAWGRAIGVATRPFLDYEGNQHPHVRFFGVMGGAAALAGFFRLPLAVTAMMVEVTGNTAFTSPLFLCCTIARVVADRIATPFINFMCGFNDYPLLKEAPPAAFRERTAFDIMTELDKGVAYATHMLGELDGSEHARWLLESTKHGSFPVVADRSHDWTLRGLIERHELAALVQAAAGGDGPEEAFRVGVGREMEVDPPVVSEGMPADRVYSWFVTLGLRRLLVVKEGTMQVTGVITRHDLHEARLQWRR